MTEGEGGRKMRVALVGRFPLPPFRFGGGVETSTFHLMEGLARMADLDIHLVSLNDRLRSSVTFTDDGITYHYLPSQRRLTTLTGFVLPARRILRTLSHLEPDIVHAQDSLMYGAICLRSPFPTVVSIHSALEEEAKYLDSPASKARAAVHLRLLLYPTIRRARHIIQPTRYPENHYGHLTEAKWHDVGNAIADRFFGVERDPHHGRILYCGAVIRRKRLGDLVQALGRVAEVRDDFVLRVAGPIPEPEYHMEVMRAADASGLTPRIEYLGLLSQDELAAEYQAAHMLVLPSAQETSPMVIGEAMAAGVPVVATRVGGVGYLIEDGETGIVVAPGSIDQLTDSVLRVLDDADLSQRLGARARESASSRFGSETVARRARSVYEEAMGEDGLG